MDVMNGILSQVSGNARVQNLAAKVGLSPEQVQQAIAALAKAHANGAANADQSVDAAHQQTGLPRDKLHQIVGQIGGEGALSKVSSMLPEGGGGLMGSVSKFL
jgi:hypothetical protein